MDTLEIVLKEHVDVVDKIFIGENQSMKFFTNNHANIFS